MSWKISVAEYLPPMDRPRTKDTTFYNPVSAGATTIDLTGTDAFWYATTNDIIKLGPSSSSANRGAVEYVRVKTRTKGTGLTNIILTTALTYAYASGDSISHTTAALPEGWIYKTSSSGTGYLDFHGHNPILKDTGKLSGFSGNSGMSYTLTSGGTGAHYLDNLINRKLIRGCTHRLGCYINSPGSNNSGVASMILYNDYAAATIISVSIVATHSVWTKKEATGTWLTGANGMRTDSRIYIAFDANHATTLTQLDCVYLTHAQLTDGYASGVYTIPTNPIEVDAQINGRVSIINDFDSYQQVGLNSISTEPMRGYRLIWDDANEVFLRNLEVLSYWQDRGFDLMLEGDFAPNLRPVFGKMQYGLSYPSWDPNRVTVTMEFEGR